MIAFDWAFKVVCNTYDSVQLHEGYLSNADTKVRILVQGVFGNMPWNVLGFQVLYLNARGIPDHIQGWIVFGQFVFQGLGGLFSGYISDFLHKRFGNWIRVFMAQFSLFFGTLVCVMIYLVRFLHLNA